MWNFSTASLEELSGSILESNFLLKCLYCHVYYWHSLTGGWAVIGCAETMQYPLKLLIGVYRSLLVFRELLRKLYLRTVFTLVFILNLCKVIQDLYKITSLYKLTSFKELFKETIFIPVFI